MFQFCVELHFRKNAVRKPEDCYGVLHVFGQRHNGIYTVYPGHTEGAVDVYCILTSEDKDYRTGWTVHHCTIEGTKTFKIALGSECPFIERLIS